MWPSRRAFDSRSRSQGAVSVTATGRSPEPQMPVRIGPAPHPWIPEGCTRGRRKPSEGGDQRSRRVADALVVQSGQDVGLSNQRSAFKSRPERADRWQKSPCARPQSESMQVRVLPDPSCRSGSRSGSPPRKREDAGASLACGLGRVGQPETDPIPSKGRSAVRVPSRPPCPRSLPDRTVAREATGGGSIPLGGVGHVV